jgi:hypothetical protein
MSPSQSGYDTISQNGFAPNEVDAEGAALLRKPSHHQDAKAPPWTARLHEHFTANVSKSWADIALLGCYIITGLLDSSSVFIWGSFVSMQTGKIKSRSPTSFSHPNAQTHTKPRQKLTIPTTQATQSTSASASSPPTTTTAGSAPASPSSPSA